MRVVLCCIAMKLVIFHFVVSKNWINYYLRNTVYSSDLHEKSKTEIHRSIVNCIRNYDDVFYVCCWHPNPKTVQKSCSKRFVEPKWVCDCCGSRHCVVVAFLSAGTLWLSEFLFFKTLMHFIVPLTIRYSLE